MVNGYIIPLTLSFMTNEMVHGGEGGDTARFIEHGVPGVLAGIEDILIGHEQAVAEEVVFEVLPGFFGGIALWGVRRDIDQGDIAGNAQLLRTVPSGAVGNHGGVDMGGECEADCIEVQLHHGGVGVGENQADGAPALRAEGAEDIGVLITCIERHRRPRAFGGPAVSAAAFLPDAGFILAPQFNGLAGMGGGDCLQCGGEFF
jgi:hypothetical protein